MEDYRDDEIPDYNLAVSVLETGKDYHIKPVGYTLEGPNKYILAFDCEMIWVKKRAGVDNRKGIQLDAKNFKKYEPVERQNPGGVGTISKNLKGYKKENFDNPDKATSFFEFLGFKEADKLAKGYFIDKTTNEPINLNKKLPETITALATGLSNVVMAFAQITIVDYNGYIIYEKYVRDFDTPIFWTSCVYSGIPQDFYTPGSPNFHKLANGTRIPESSFDTYANIRTNVLSLFKDKTIVAPIYETIVIGHNIIQSDFPALEINIVDGAADANSIEKRLIRDTDKYYGIKEKVGPPSALVDGIKGVKLKNIIKKYLNKDIQNSASGHDASEDARGSLAVYLLNKSRYDRTFNNNNLPVGPYGSTYDPKYSINSLLEMLVHYSSIHNRGTDKKAIIDRIIIYIKGLLN
jgi:hypothetical protein